MMNAEFGEVTIDALNPTLIGIGPVGDFLFDCSNAVFCLDLGWGPQDFFRAGRRSSAVLANPGDRLKLGSMAPQ